MGRCRRQDQQEGGEGGESRHGNHSVTSRRARERRPDVPFPSTGLPTEPNRIPEDESDGRASGDLRHEAGRESADTPCTSSPTAATTAPIAANAPNTRRSVSVSSSGRGVSNVMARLLPRFPESAAAAATGHTRSLSSGRRGKCVALGWHLATRVAADVCRYTSTSMVPFVILTR